MADACVRTRTLFAWLGDVTLLAARSRVERHLATAFSQAARRCGALAAEQRRSRSCPFNSHDGPGPPGEAEPPFTSLKVREYSKLTDHLVRAMERGRSVPLALGHGGALSPRAGASA